MAETLAIESENRFKNSHIFYFCKFIGTFSQKCDGALSEGELGDGSKKRNSLLIWLP